MNEYTLGQSVKLQTAFLDEESSPINPITVRCTVRSPDGEKITYVAPDVTNPELGLFRLILQADLAGLWVYRWEGDSPDFDLYQRKENTFYVNHSSL
jgi:hypothetical protein